MPTNNTTPTNGYADIASILGSFSSGRKADRLVEGNFTGDWDKLNQDRTNLNNLSMLKAQQDRNANELDAWKKLQATSYILGGGANLAPMSIQSMGRQTLLPNFDFGMKAPSEAEKQGASSLQSMLMPRLASGGSFMPDQMPELHPLESYAKPGKLENIASYTGAGTGILGGLNAITGNKGLGGIIGAAGRLFGRGGGAATADPGSIASIMQGDGSTASTGAATGAASGVLGKALPIAGIALGGYGLMKDRGKAGNAMNGASVGAGVGSLIAPGIGTAIGAGVGALGGLVRGAFGHRDPSGSKDKAAAVQMISTSATPEQRAEAQKAGWSHPEDALASIVVRDALRAKGLPDTSSALMQQLFSASAKGPAAVQAATQQILQTLGIDQQSAIQGGQPGGPAGGPMTSGTFSLTNSTPRTRPAGW